ncbi:putative ankyrin repeat protein [Diplodia seriata]|uniref:Putative ankyrin repeat protein n=1 Tax=Diplodia seriata TaxID=420778 RepID=A0A1S8B7Z7_9PEZI|nr:putative ankyrin repeat protein [Diplodia seriata]
MRFRVHTNSPVDGIGSHHIPEGVVLSLVNCILESQIDRLVSFLQSPYRFVISNWHIDFTPIYHGKPAFEDVLGKSLLSLAASDATPEIVALLLREGANVDFKDLRTCDTPLITAIRRGDCSIVSLLLENGASMALLNSDGLHALQVAALFAKEPGIMDQLAIPQSALLDAPAAEGPHEGATALELVLKRRVKYANGDDYLLANRYARTLLGAGAHFQGLEYLIVQPWLDYHAYRRGTTDDEFALLRDFVKAGLSLQTPVNELPDGSHRVSVAIGHALAFHSVEPGMASFLARSTDFSSVRNASEGLLRTLCSGCPCNRSPRIEDDTRAAVEILLELGADPNAVDKRDRTPLDYFLDSVTWYDFQRGHPTRIEILRLLFKHSADPCRAKGNMDSIKQALGEEDYDNQKKAYVFDVVCLLLKQCPNDVHYVLERMLLQRQDKLNTTHRLCFKNSFSEKLFLMYSELPESSAKIVRLAAEHVARGKFMDEQLSLGREERNYYGILQSLKRQQSVKLLGGRDGEVMLPRKFVVDVLELLLK